MLSYLTDLYSNKSYKDTHFFSFQDKITIFAEEKNNK